MQGACKEYGAPVPGVASFMVWSLHAQGGSTPPQGGPRLLGCTIMWSELAHVGRYDLRFRESQEPQGPLGEAKSHT